MKNRLQFNRIPKLFKADDIISAGTTTHVSGREMAYQGISAYIQQRDFIPLIGEPIVARYVDQNNKKQAILAIGKATGKTDNDIYGIEYHIIDTAAMQEGIDLANENASEAIELASAATKDTADYLTILKNMIMSGIGLSDGTYFDNNGRWDRDPSKVGLYDQDKVSGTFYLREAESFMDADQKLDAAIVGTNAWFNGRCDDIQGQLNDEKGYRKALKLIKINSDKFEELGIGDDVRDAYFLTHHKPNSTEPYEDPQEGDVIIKVYKETVTWDDLANFSGITESYFKNIIEAEGLNPDGTYDHERAHDSINFKDAFDAFTADELLDQAITDLSANTMTADQELADRISELEGNKVLGVSAITVDVLENGDSKVSLVINEEDDKILSQNALGLKAKVTLDYVSADKKIYLKGKDDIIISEVDATDFIKDGMLDSANVIVATEEDHAQYPELIVGKTYIKLLFNTDAEQPGKANPVFISADDLVDIYTVNPYSGGTSMLIDDYVITLVIDNALHDGSGLASWAYASSISAVTNNIIKAAGLTEPGEEGRYPGHSAVTCYYISAATSLDNADVILDNALWATSGLIADVSNRVDELSAVTREFSAHTVEALSALSSSIDERIESGLTIISGVVENYVEERLSGLNFDEIYEYVDNSVEALSGALLDYVIDNEEVTAAALNDLNDRLGTVETHMNGDYIPLTGYEISTASTPEDLIIDDDDTVNEAFGKVQKQVFDNDDAISGLDERLTIIEGAVADNSGVTILSAAVVSFSAATFNEFNEVNDKINNLSGNVNTNTTNITILSGMLESVSAQTSGVLTVNVNGQQQGKYCPSANTTLDLEIIQEVTGADVLLTGYELSSAHTEEELTVYETDNVNEAFGKVQRQIIDNEAVTAGALNDLNDRINAIGSGGSADVANLSGNVMSNFVHSAEYFSENDTHEIRFKNANGAVISTVNADDFIKDGMVETVYVSGQSLVIEFNTASQKETIVLALSDIFNPDNYYTKSEVNALSSATVNMSGAVVNNQTNISTVSGDVISLSASVVANKTNITALSAGTIQLSADTKAAIAALSAGTIQLSADTYSAISALTNEMYVNELVIAAAFNDINDRVIELSGRTVDLSNYYTKNEVYNKAEVDAKITSGGSFDPTQYYTKTDCDNLFETKANVSVLSSATRSISQSLNTLSSATHNKFANLSGSVIDLSAATITGVTLNGTAGVREGQVIKLTYSAPAGGGITGVSMNGSEVTVTNDVAVLGSVITSETQLSTAVTGSGNVFSTIQVSNHKITMGKNFTAATKANLDTLSGAIQNNYYTTANTYNKTEVNNLISGATLRKYQTASTLTNLDFQEFLTIVKINGNTTLSIASSGLPVLPANGVAERHVIIENTGNTDAVVTISSDARVKLTLNDKIAIDRNGIGELNALITYDGSAYTIYIITT